MANREKGEVALTVCGRTYTFVLNTNAMAAVEAKISNPGQELNWDYFWKRLTDPGRASVSDVKLLMWAMARKYHGDLSLDDVGDLIDEAGGMEGMHSVLTAANQASTPDAEDMARVRSKGSKSRPRKAQGMAGAASISPRDSLA